MEDRMNRTQLIKEIQGAQEYFERSTRVLDESDSSYKPSPDSMSVAQQFGHVASTIHWLLDGATNPNGFDMDFAKHAEEMKQMTSVAAMRGKVSEAFMRALKQLSIETDESLATSLPAGPIMGGEPRSVAFWSISEHTAHHRGALSVYSRMRGKAPAMPYMEM
jgi:uncharacterized damage-inducible protein DinB